MAETRYLSTVHGMKKEASKAPIVKLINEFFSSLF